MSHVTYEVGRCHQYYCLQTFRLKIITLADKCKSNSGDQYILHNIKQNLADLMWNTLALLLISFKILTAITLLQNKKNQVSCFFQDHATKVVRLFEDVFSWLPLATVVDQKVLVAHGGISSKTDLEYLGKIDRHKVSIFV